MRFVEDWVVGATQDLGRHTFTAEEIVEFARDFDPQPFHLDEEAGRRSLFGGLAASGWHVACAWMRLWIDYQNQCLATLPEGAPRPVPGPSPGFEDMRWLKPVLAGTTLSFRSTVVRAHSSASRPGWGLMTSRTEAFDEAGDMVFHFTCHVFVPTRPKPAA